jgi:hypothetical protein
MPAQTPAVPKPVMATTNMGTAKPLEKTPQPKAPGTLNGTMKPNAPKTSVTPNGMLKPNGPKAPNTPKPTVPKSPASPMSMQKQRMRNDRAASLPPALKQVHDALPDRDDLGDWDDGAFKDYLQLNELGDDEVSFDDVVMPAKHAAKKMKDLMNGKRKQQPNSGPIKPGGIVPPGKNPKKGPSPVTGQDNKGQKNKGGVPIANTQPKPTPPPVNPSSQQDVTEDDNVKDWDNPDWLRGRIDTIKGKLAAGQGNADNLNNKLKKLQDALKGLKGGDGNGKGGGNNKGGADDDDGLTDEERRKQFKRIQTRGFRQGKRKSYPVPFTQTNYNLGGNG